MITPASDTGAVELALWNLLGPLPVDVMGWEVFGKIWVTDILKQLKLKDARSFETPFGELPPLDQINSDHDIVFTWNGTTSGVKVPHADWIKDDRQGLTICDATSAVFAMEMPWHKLDVTTWSWQKVLGSETAHGMLVLSPRAIARLESYTPPWPLPKIFRITKNNQLLSEPFEGKTLNTPSMLAVEDCLDALAWAEKIGGLPALLKRTNANLEALTAWLSMTDWAENLAKDPTTASNTSMCFKVVDPWFLNFPQDEQTKMIKAIEKMLEKEGVAFEVANHKDAPASFRLWGGATVETTDVKAVLPWIDYAYRTMKAEKQAIAA
jgi:phosphoserine aminotransferase